MSRRNFNFGVVRSMSLTLAVVGTLCLGVSGCNSHARSKADAGQSAGNKADQLAAKQQSAMTAPNNPDPGIDVNCISDHLQNPPESFHYSYSNLSASNPVSQSADVSPRNIDGTYNNNGQTGAFHGTRSDAASWQSAQSHLMGIGGMAVVVAIVNHNSALVRQGTESVNGYDTIKYTIDTTRADPSEQGLYKAALGAGGFEKGVVWVTAQGCPVKFILSTEYHYGNGKVETVQYEEAMVRPQPAP